MFAPSVAFLASILNKSRQCVSRCVGFVLVLLIMFRLGLTHTRLNGLRAANSNLPAVVLSVASVSLSSCLLCFVRLPRVSRRDASGGVVFGVGFGSLLSSLSLSLLPACRYPL